MNKEAVQFICQAIQSNAFSAGQLAQLIYALHWGMNVEQLNIVANPMFDWRQMEQVMFALKRGLTEEQVRKIADSHLTWEQMREKRYAFQEDMRKAKK